MDRNLSYYTIMIVECKLTALSQNFFVERPVNWHDGLIELLKKHANSQEHVCFGQRVIELDANFTPMCMAHPDTYINKIVVGSREGSIQLWNIHSGKLVYTFKGW